MSNPGLEGHPRWVSSVRAPVESPVLCSCCREARRAGNEVAMTPDPPSPPRCAVRQGNGAQEGRGAGGAARRGRRLRRRDDWHQSLGQPQPALLGRRRGSSGCAGPRQCGGRGNATGCRIAHHVPGPVCVGRFVRIMLRLFSHAVWSVPASCDDSIVLRFFPLSSNACYSPPKRLMA